MPNEQFYDGLTLAAAIRELAEHHWHPDTRHISAFEFDLLMHAAAELAQLNAGKSSATVDKPN